MISKTIIKTTKIKTKKYNYLEVAKIYKIFSNATRLEIIFILSDKEESFANLLKILKISKSSLSQHINTLSMIGFVEVEKKGRNIYCKTSSEKISKMIKAFKALLDNHEIVFKRR